MALTRCPRCSEELSDKVAICPHCDYSLHGPAADAPSATDPAEMPPDLPKPESKPKPVESASAALVRYKPKAPPGVQERSRQIYTEQRPIPAIKYWSQVTGARLTEAKAFHDQESKAGRLSRPSKRSQLRGCLVAWLVGLLVLVLSTVAALLESSHTHSGHHHPGRMMSHHRH
jgi:hypothetical protein